MKSTPITIEGLEFSSLAKAAKHFNLEPHTLRARIREGRDPLQFNDNIASRLAQQSGLSRSTVSTRLKRGLDPVQAVVKPAKRYASGEWATLVAKASLIGLTGSGLRQRLQSGMSIEVALRRKVLNSGPRKISENDSTFD